MPLTTTFPLGLNESFIRCWDNKYGCWAIKLMPGQVYVTSKKDEMLTTTLGSCVSACIRDNQLGIGGINHFMLPAADKNCLDSWLHMATRYGEHAMEMLINEILKKGGCRSNLEVKLTGGSKILANMRDIGMQNIEFAKSYVDRKSLNLLAEDLGGVHPRRISYSPVTGILRVKKLHSLDDEIPLTRENDQNKMTPLKDFDDVKLL